MTQLVNLFMKAGLLSKIKFAKILNSEEFKLKFFIKLKKYIHLHWNSIQSIRINPYTENDYKNLKVKYIFFP